MPRRNSPNDIADLGDLSRLTDYVHDKRLGQRASAKKNRRNRHYEKQFIRNTLAHLPRSVTAAAAGTADRGDDKLADEGPAHVSPSSNRPTPP
ncbi:hypothetical protein IP87_14060 [beta proteobacterium AAP121]|nr:hypothetical protein IP80_15915 [beta proteobacterium AAP65]KPF96423.1 hypothetical protein IP87_14060 [beta proteobacterium AAP121]